MKYNVATMRSAGLEARWTRTRNNAPIIAVRNPNSDLKHQRETWYVVDDRMWKRMQDAGVMAGYDQATLLGNFFSVQA
jgi:hypothetical protein